MDVMPPPFDDEATMALARRAQAGTDLEGVPA